MDIERMADAFADSGSAYLNREFGPFLRRKLVELLTQARNEALDEAKRVVNKMQADTPPFLAMIHGDDVCIALEELKVQS